MVIYIPICWSWAPSPPILLLPNVTVSVLSQSVFTEQAVLGYILLQLIIEYLFIALKCMFSVIKMPQRKVFNDSDFDDDYNSILFAKDKQPGKT